MIQIGVSAGGVVAVIAAAGAPAVAVGAAVVVVAGAAGYAVYRHYGSKRAEPSHPASAATPAAAAADGEQHGRTAGEEPNRSVPGLGAPGYPHLVPEEDAGWSAEQGRSSSRVP